jgi:superfamily I DNA/RNA helicase
MHRAKHLADALGDQTGKPILFTTFTRNLVEAIERDLRELGGADLLDAVEVLNVDALANRLVKEAEGGAPSVISGDELAGLWDEVADEVGGLFRGDFLANEWEQVILAQACRSRDDYLRASRPGRGVRLDRRSRAELWRAVETFLQRLVERNQRTFLQMADAAAGHLERRAVRPYQHVIVDEAQDLHESQWRMLRAVVAEAPNDLFVVGDSHQRIYDRRTSLSKVDINIRGRSRRLRINYRTTFEILRWSLALLGEEPYDDLDEGIEQDDFAGYHSFLHGPRPSVVGFPSKRAQYEALAEQLARWIDSGVHEEDIAVCARSGGFDAVTSVLKNAGILPCILGREVPKEDGVRIGTMHRLKGIEFRCVAVIDADDDSVPAQWALTPEALDPVQHALDLRRERCVLYVACTRARDDLWVAWSGKRSRFLDFVA